MCWQCYLTEAWHLVLLIKPSKYGIKVYGDVLLERNSLLQLELAKIFFCSDVSSIGATGALEILG